MTVHSHSPLPARVMIDALYWRPGASGIGRYTEQIVRNCLELDPAIRFRLITPPDHPRPIRHERVDCRPFRAPPNSLRTQFLLPYVVDFDDVDLFHGPANFLPIVDVPVPTVLTLHDVMWLRDGHYWSDRWWDQLITGSFYRTMLPASVGRADRVVTVSESVQGEIEEMFPNKKGRVDVSYNGVDPFFQPVDPAEGWPLLNDLVPPREKFVLVVGRGAPYKNHGGAVAAFLRAFEDDPDVYLVMVRNKVHAREPRFQELKRDPRIASRIIEVDYVDGDRLRALYSLATAFLFPSFYEGFGLPIVEAMACGTPVVTSNLGAPAEVGGTAALRRDPHRPGEIAEALREVVYDRSVYETYRRRGLGRAAEFTWKRCGRAVLETYRRLLD